MKVSLTKIECGRRTRAATALLALALLPFIQVPRARAQSAQQPGRQDAPQPQAGQQEGGRRARRGDGNILIQRLNLTPEQRERLREIRAQSEADARELTRRVRLARRALDEAIYADTLDETRVEGYARALSDAQAALLRLRASTELKVRRVLTPAQLQTFRELRRQAQRRQRLQSRRRRLGQPPPPADDENN